MANAGIMATCVSPSCPTSPLCWLHHQRAKNGADTYSVEGQHTKQGYTLQTGTNVLGHQALISLLLPTLLATSRQRPADPARVILLSSAGHALAPAHGMDYNSLIADADILAAIKRGESPTQSKRGKNELDRMTEYAQSKWADLALSKYLEGVYGPNGDQAMEGRRVGEGELINFSVHPGTSSFCRSALPAVAM